MVQVAGHNVIELLARPPEAPEAVPPRLRDLRPPGHVEVVVKGCDRYVIHNAVTYTPKDLERLKSAPVRLLVGGGGGGTGTFASANGLILTNHHVIESVDQIEIALADARKVPARVVGTDPETDEEPAPDVVTAGFVYLRLRRDEYTAPDLAASEPP